MAVELPPPYTVVARQLGFLENSMSVRRFLHWLKCCSIPLTIDATDQVEYCETTDHQASKNTESYAQSKGSGVGA